MASTFDFKPIVLYSNQPTKQPCSLEESYISVQPETFPRGPQIVTKPVHEYESSLGDMTIATKFSQLFGNLRCVPHDFAKYTQTQVLDAIFRTDPWFRTSFDMLRMLRANWAPRESRSSVNAAIEFFRSFTEGFRPVWQYDNHWFRKYFEDVPEQHDSGSTCLQIEHMDPALHYTFSNNKIHLRCQRKVNPLLQYGNVDSLFIINRHSFEIKNRAFLLFNLTNPEQVTEMLLRKHGARKVTYVGEDPDDILNAFHDMNEYDWVLFGFVPTTEIIFKSVINTKRYVDYFSGTILIYKDQTKQQEISEIVRRYGLFGSMLLPLTHKKLKSIHGFIPKMTNDSKNNCYTVDQDATIDKIAQTIKQKKYDIVMIPRTFHRSKTNGCTLHQTAGTLLSATMLLHHCLNPGGSAIIRTELCFTDVQIEATAILLQCFESASLKKSRYRSIVDNTVHWKCLGFRPLTPDALNVIRSSIESMQQTTGASVHRFRIVSENNFKKVHAYCGKIQQYYLDIMQRYITQVKDFLIWKNRIDTFPLRGEDVLTNMRICQFRHSVQQCFEENLRIASEYINPAFVLIMSYWHINHPHKKRDCIKQLFGKPMKHIVLPYNAPLIRGGVVLDNAILAAIRTGIQVDPSICRLIIVNDITGYHAVTFSPAFRMTDMIMRTWNDYQCVCRNICILPISVTIKRIDYVSHLIQISSNEPIVVMYDHLCKSVLSEHIEPMQSVSGNHALMDVISKVLQFQTSGLKLLIFKTDDMLCKRTLDKTAIKRFGHKLKTVFVQSTERDGSCVLVYF